jgi:IclR helix-turn-helix domain
METNDEFDQRIRREQQFAARLHLATERLEEAQRERVWAIVEAHQAELSVRQIAAATGLSSSQVHQLLGSDEAREIPRWLSQQRRRNRPDRPRQEATRSPFAPDLQACLASELEALRRCREWLERLDRGETVVVNLRPETDPETEYVAFDRPRVLRVLARIIADLDDLAGYPPSAEEKAVKGEDAEARRVRHRQRLAEPEPPPKRLTMREERAALRALLDPPPSKRG